MVDGCGCCIFDCCLFDVGIVVGGVFDFVLYWRNFFIDCCYGDDGYSGVGLKLFVGVLV